MKTELLTFEKKIESIKKAFSTLSSQEEKYFKVMEFGKELSSAKQIQQTPENLVKGCQSIVYIQTTQNEDRFYFEASSDALVSGGLASLLIQIYNGETIQTLLSPPTFLKQLGIEESLTPNRANGLHYIHLKMKQDAIKLMSH